MTINTTPRLARLLPATIALLVALLVGGASSAAAVESPSIPDLDQSSSPSTGTCSVGGQSLVDGDQYLPINRWVGSTEFHSRTSGLVSIGTINRARRDMVAGTLISAGDTFWAGTAGITEAATNFCPLEVAGPAIDTAAAELGEFIFDSDGAGPVAVVVVVALLGYTIWSGRKRGVFPWKSLGAKVLVLAVMVVMMNGAMRTTEDSYGNFSPAWLMDKVFSTVQAVSSIPASVLTLDNSGTTPASSVSDEEMIGCPRYTEELRHQFWDANGGLEAAAMPLIMNEMWEVTGLQAWKSAQFGTSDYADLVYCRLLDENANIAVGHLTRPDRDTSASAYQQWPSSRMGVMSHYWSGPQPYAEATAWTAVNDITRDVSLVAWATCVPDGDTWSYRQPNGGMIADDAEPAGSGNAQPGGDGGTTCAGWWNQPAFADSGGFDDGGSEFNREPDIGTINSELDRPAANFVNSMHSANAGTASMVALGYTFSALLVLAIFGFLSLVIMLAKVMSLLLILVTFAVLLIAVLPGQPTGRLVGGFAARSLGTVLLTAGAVLIYSTVGALTVLVVRMGMTFMTPGTVPAMFWTGLAPLAAVVGLSWLFKNVLKVPNPLSLKGAGAWVKSSGGIGSAVGGAVGGLAGSTLGSRMSHQAKGVAGQASRKVGSAAVHKASGGRFGRQMGGRPDARMDPLPRRDNRQVGKWQSSTSENASVALGDMGTVGEPGSGTSGASLPPEQTGSVGKGRRGAKPIELTPHERQARDDARSAGERAILTNLGVSKNASGSEKRKALRGFYRDEVRQARQISKDEWAQRNAHTVRGAIRKRQIEAAKDNPGAGNGHRVALRPLDVAGGVKDAATARTKRVASGMRNAPVRTLVSGAARGAKTAAKIGGGTFAVAALGPAGVAAVGGTYLAAKGMKAAGARRQQRTTLALNALASQQEAEAQAEEQEAARKKQEEQAENSSGNSGEPGIGAAGDDGNYTPPAAHPPELSAETDTPAPQDEREVPIGTSAATQPRPHQGQAPAPASRPASSGEPLA